MMVAYSKPNKCRGTEQCKTRNKWNFQEYDERKN